MKTKLLRKIRRKYEVMEVVKPEGYFEVGYFNMGLVYKLTGGLTPSYFKTMQQALDRMLEEVKLEYKPRLKGEYIKVWYNNHKNV